MYSNVLVVGVCRALLPDRPCFRDEASRADRSPGEFYQIDLEMAFATRRSLFHEVERCSTY